MDVVEFGGGDGVIGGRGHGSRSRRGHHQRHLPLRHRFNDLQRGNDATLVVVSGTAPAIGAGNQFTAMARFADGSIQDVTSQATWTSSNTDVATVDGGLVTGVAAGVVTISAKYQNLTGSATFNIVGS